MWGVTWYIIAFLIHDAFMDSISKAITPFSSRVTRVSDFSVLSSLVTIREKYYSPFISGMSGFAVPSSCCRMVTQTGFPVDSSQLKVKFWLTGH